ADELALFDLVTHIQSHIITSERPWLLKNLIKVYQFSELTDNFSKLRDHCQEIIDKTPDLVFDHHITFGSELISSRQAALITCWIEEREFSFEKVRKNHYLHYKLRLLMRGSRDGMRVSDFHRICDDTGPTVVVIKIRESNCRRFGRDLMWFNGTSLHSDYEKNIFMPDNFNMVRFYEKNFFRPDTFDVMDFEVFQVIKMDEVFTYN
ncbi:1513_t:CDS:2, partial [Gigaspora margarita]